MKLFFFCHFFCQGIWLFSGDLGRFVIFPKTVHSARSRYWVKWRLQEHRSSNQQPYFQMGKDVSTCDTVVYLNSLHHGPHGKTKLPSTESICQAPKWVGCCVSAHFSILSGNSCDQTVNKRCPISFVNTLSSLFFQDNCIKHSGSTQEGVEFEDNSHNSLEPRGECAFVRVFVCVCVGGQPLFRLIWLLKLSSWL